MVNASKAYSAVNNALRTLHGKGRTSQMMPYNVFGEDCQSVEELAAMNRKSELVAAAWAMDHADTVSPALRDSAVRYMKALAPGPDSNSDGVCVVLTFDRNAREQIAMAGGEDSDDLHITLGYFGSNEDMPADAMEIMRKVVANAARLGSVFSVNLNGITRFSGDDSDAFVLNADSPAINPFRTRLLDALANEGIRTNTEHGYTPHLTLGYLAYGDQMPITRWSPMRVDVDMVELWFGKARMAFELGVDTGPIEPLDAGTEPAIAMDARDMKIPPRLSKDVFRGQGVGGVPNRGTAKRCKKILERNKRVPLRKVIK